MPPSRREDLIEAAVRVFCQEGFHATGIDRVLKEAGVSRMTLYNHFRSKDELIVAAMRRRDEQFRNRLLKDVNAMASDARGRLVAVFDVHEQWACSDGFSGCMFLNASAEFADASSPIRRFCAETKRLGVEYLQELCTAAGLRDPKHLARQLDLLLEGAIVMARLSQGSGNGADPGEPVRLAKQAAMVLIDEATPPA
ncbi:MAG: TetR/AcrR family transcriptional regulator [Planctomycetota bacterium]|jgi:AcrR family transcriptional regulator